MTGWWIITIYYGLYNLMNNSMKSLRLLLILILVGCGVAFTHSERVYAAPLLTLDPLTITVSRDQPTTISLVVDTTPHTTLTSAVTLRYQTMS